MAFRGIPMVLRSLCEICHTRSVWMNLHLPSTSLFEVINGCNNQYLEKFIEKVIVIYY